jgi:DNA-binding NarL/FixJ family response regulator
VVILDITLGDTDGIPLIAAVRAAQPRASVLVLSMHRDPETVRQALLGGAVGYLVKGAYASELLASIRAVARGERYLHSSVTDTVIDDSIRWIRAGSELTAREREVLSLFASGMSATAIGRSLGISANTVRRHLANLAAKLNLKGRPALTRYANQHGVVRSSTAP